MLKSLRIPSEAVIGEIGVALGDLSEYLIREMRPIKYVAFDTFDLHKMDALWGKKTCEVFGGKTHREYFDKRMSKYKCLVTEEGLSNKCLETYKDKTFDLLYIDAGHTYEAVKMDADLAKRKICNDGIIVFNDYIMFDHFVNMPYGIVPVVNEMVVNEGWQVIGFAFEKNLFCDIALARKGIKLRAR